MKTNIKNFLEIYNIIQNIGTQILHGVNQSGSIGEIWKGKYDYFLVELNYRDFGEELTKNIKIPFELFEKKNKTAIDRFIREQISNFNTPF
ncbi:MAG: hypothetical protein J1F35_05670 [Erysipelotrichales bacterium]|nr:hypothetical protein [Erysipelotrichales bacterium]